MRIVIRSLFLVFISFLMQCATPNLRAKKDTAFADKPEFYTLKWRQPTRVSKASLPIFLTVDSVEQQQLKLLTAKESPVLYTADISAPVCADGECKLMNISLFWSLLGDYAGYTTIENSPLTKHDHDAFLQADYLKLHQLLLDKNSIVKNRKIDELVRSPEELKLAGIDALSGATIKEVKESVVEGALYSCYVAWHLAHNAEVTKKMKMHTNSIMTTAMLIDMLNEDDMDYQLYALENMDFEQYQLHFNRISAIFKSSTPLVRSLIIKKLPATFWQRSVLQYEFWNHFSILDINSRSLLLKQIDEVPVQVLEVVSQELAVMTKNQLKIYLESVQPIVFTNLKIRTNISLFATTEKNIYNYLGKEFLEGLE